MFIEITTKIVTKIDLDTMEPETQVHIECSDDLPRNLIAAAVIGGCRSTIANLEGTDGDREAAPGERAED